MADALCYIFNIVWAWKLKHNKNSRHVSAITDRQTVQTQIYTDTLGQKTSLHPKNDGLKENCLLQDRQI